MCHLGVWSEILFLRPACQRFSPTLVHLGAQRTPNAGSGIQAPQECVVAFQRLGAKFTRQLLSHFPVHFSFAGRGLDTSGFIRV